MNHFINYKKLKNFDLVLVLFESLDQKGYNLFLRKLCQNEEKNLLLFLTFLRHKSRPYPRKYFFPKYFFKSTNPKKKAPTQFITDVQTREQLLGVVTKKYKKRLKQKIKRYIKKMVRKILGRPEEEFEDTVYIFRNLYDYERYYKKIFQIFLSTLLERSLSKSGLLQQRVNVLVYYYAFQGSKKIKGSLSKQSSNFSYNLKQKSIKKNKHFLLVVRNLEKNFDYYCTTHFGQFNRLEKLQLLQIALFFLHGYIHNNLSDD
uniref:hypothetical protein n=1 Tax=Fibrocapsa japonica TaxID=94617 RepID=UPI0021142EE8|nr:hypothetical protein NQZ09_pgp067 [Fibrocapsa japonica]UTE95238.1 hypothetical protein FjapPt_p157 [Fibrocapsa japonica]